MSCGSLFKDQMVPFSGFPSILGIAGLRVPTGFFFHAQNTCPSRHYGRAFPKYEDEPLFS